MFLGVTFPFGCDCLSSANPYHWFCGPMSSFQLEYQFMKTGVRLALKRISKETWPQQGWPQQSLAACNQCSTWVPGLWESTDAPRMREELWDLVYKRWNALWKGKQVSTIINSPGHCESLIILLECQCIFNSACKVSHILSPVTSFSEEDNRRQGKKWRSNDARLLLVNLEGVMKPFDSLGRQTAFSALTMEKFKFSINPLAKDDGKFLRDYKESLPLSG